LKLKYVIRFTVQGFNMGINGENITFWNRIAKQYDWITIMLTRDYPSLIQRIAHDVQGAENILEIATGTGFAALELAGKGGIIDAIDFSSNMIDRAQRKAFEAHIENIRFSVQSAYSLGFEDHRFDAAVCLNAFHCMEDPGKALSEIRRVLKKQGLLIAPTFCHGENRRSLLLSRIMNATGFKSYHQFSTGEFFHLVTSCGFTIMKKDISNDFIPLAYVVARGLS
jgi:phosphatidylethanolamine/phosphatidyl-N-methylethanolamine N-methyltransferase